MRHVLAPLAVALLAQRVPPSAQPASLVRPRRVTLASATSATRAVGAAVPVPRHIAHRAQRQHPAARRVLANNKLQRDHGPQTRCSTSARTYATQEGRFATSRSSGAIEGTEFELRVLAMCVIADGTAVASTPLMTSTANPPAGGRGP